MKKSIVGLGKCLLASCCALGIACLAPMDESTAAQNKQQKSQKVQRKSPRKASKSAAGRSSGRVPNGQRVGWSPGIPVSDGYWLGVVVGYDQASKLYSVKLEHVHGSFMFGIVGPSPCTQGVGISGGTKNVTIKVPGTCLKKI